MDAALHPDYASQAGEFVRDAGSVAPRETRARWIVPGYEPALARALAAGGWASSVSYEVCVSPVAQRVAEPSLSPAMA